ADRGAHGVADLGGAGFVGDDVEVAVGVGRLVVDCRRDDAVVGGERGDGGLDGAGGAHHVAQRALRRGDHEGVGVLRVDGADGRGFDAVVELGAGAVRVDVVDSAGFEARAAHGVAHGLGHPVAVLGGGDHVEGVVAGGGA